MRSRTLLALIPVAFLFVLPIVAHAGGIPFFGPIIPVENNQCAAGWGMLMTVINNIISLLITLAIVFVAPLTIAYAGFLYVVNPVDPSGISKAKGILWNTVIGIVIALCGWLIVDAVMAVLYNANAPVGTTGGTLGAWTSLISGGGDPCIKLEASLNQSAGQNVTGVTASGSGVYLNGKSAAVCPAANTACSPAVLQSVGFTSAQANVMSCIAVTESSGNPAGPNSPTGACGTFQITRGNWNTASLHQPPCSTATSCNDAACNLQAAYLLAKQNVAAGKSLYQPWTCTGCNSKAAACVQQYSNG